MKMPVARSSSCDEVGSEACVAVLGAYAVHLGRPQPVEQRGVHLDDLGAQRGRRRDHRDAGLRPRPRARRTPCSTVRLPSLSSAPPMTSRSPGHPEPSWTHWHDRKPKGCIECASEPAFARFVRVGAAPSGDHAARQGRGLRAPRTTAAASPTAATATPPPRVSGSPTRASCPTHAFVSSATRTRQTWKALVEGTGTPAEARVEDAVYTADADSALDVLRDAPPRRRDRAVRRPQPDGGLAGAPARRRRPRPGRLPRDERGLSDVAPSPSWTSRSRGPSSTSAPGT